MKLKKMYFLFSRMCDHRFLKQSEYLYCVPALTLDDSRTLSSQKASGRCSVLCPEDVETVSPEFGSFCRLSVQKMFRANKYLLREGFSI